MPQKKLFTKATVALIGLLFLIVAAICYFFFSEADLSFAKLEWRSRFDKELRENGQVKLAELVTFPWDKIYLLEAYDTLNSQQEAELFPQQSWLSPFWWKYREGYWTIAYQRSGQPPFLVRVAVKDWQLRKRTNSWTDDPSAILRRVPTGTIEATYCLPALNPNNCLSLVDSRSTPPTEQLH